MSSQVRIFIADLQDPAHGEAVLEMICAYAAEPMGSGESLPVDVRENLLPGLQAQPGTLVLLAEVDHRPVGVAVCFRGFSTFYAKPLLNIHDLAVVDGYRGRGIGQTLLAAVEEQARALGCCRITLEVRSDNEGAQRLYRALGFSGGAPGEEEAEYLFWKKPLE